MTTQLNNVYLRSGGKLSLALGTDPTRVYGSTDADVVTIAAGVSVVLDGSFNRGNDIIRFTGNAASYSVVRVNASTVRITDAAGTSVTIPVGSAGTAIEFADATRTLSGSSAGILLGNQTITATPVVLAAGTAPAPVEEYVLTSSAPTVTEGNDGTKTLTYLLTLNKAPTSEVTVNYQTTDAGTAAAGDDFQVVAGVATFAPGQTATTVSVTVYADTIVEADETVALRLSGSKLVAAVDALGTIRNDDSAPVDPSAYTVTAGDIAAANASNVPVTLNIGNTGNKTVTIQSDGASATQGIIINGDANATVNSGAAGDKITISGNGTNAINTGGGNDNVSVYGSGTNTINVGTGSDTVTGGSGNDTIVFGSGALGAGDVVIGGTGNDTVRISGDGNVVGYDANDDGDTTDGGDIAGALLIGVENIVLDGTTLEIPAVMLERLIEGGLKSITGSSLTTELTITGLNTVGTLDLSGVALNGGLEKVITQGTGTLILNTTQADQIEAISASTGTLSQQVVVTGPQTVAQAQALIASGETAKFTLVDTAANLALAPKAVFAKAVSVEATTDATAAQAVQIASVIASLASTNASLYTGSAFVDAGIKVNVTDTASMLANNVTGLAIADKVTATTAATVDEAKAIVNANAFVAGVPLFTASYTVEDTATALNAADFGSLTVTTVLNSTAVTTTSSTTGITAGMGISGPGIPAGATVTSVSGGNITISVPATAAGTGVAGYVSGAANGSVVNGAESVKISGSASVAQVAAINADLAALTGGPAKVVSGYDLRDLVGNITGAPTGVIADARNITVVNSSGQVQALSVANATAIELLSNSGTNVYKLEDTALALRNASSAVAAVGVANGSVVLSDSTVNVANFNALVAKYGNAAFTTSAVITDTAAELVKLTNAALVENAGVTIAVDTTSTATVAQLNALNAFFTNPNTGVRVTGAPTQNTVKIKDTAANLAAAIKDLATLAALDAAGTVTVSDAASVEQIAAINEALAGAKEVEPVYTLEDTASNLAAGTAEAIVDAADKVRVTGAATVDQIDTIADALFYGETATDLSTKITFALRDYAASILSGTVSGGAVGALATYTSAATSISITNAAVSPSDAVSLRLLSKFDRVYAIEGNVSELNSTAAGTADALAGATTVTLVAPLDATSNGILGANGIAARALADKVIAYDSLADLTAASAADKATVDGFRLSDGPLTASSSNIANVNALLAIKPTEYEVAGSTFVQLMASGTALATFVQKAASIIVYDGTDEGSNGPADDLAVLTVEQFNALDARANGAIVFDLQDTAANLASSRASAAIAAVAAAKLAGHSADVSVTATLPGDNLATVAEAKVLIARGISGFVISDTAENISAAGDDVLLAKYDSTHYYAADIVINDDGKATLSVDQAIRVFDGINATNNATTPDGSAAAKYNLVDTAANLAVASPELIGFAQNVTATTAATTTSVTGGGTEISKLAGFSSMGQIVFDIEGATYADVDEAANKARGVTVTDAISVGDAVLLQAKTNSGTTSYKISDNASALALQNNPTNALKIAAIEAATGTVVVSGSGYVNAAQATLIAAYAKPVVYDLVDTATALSAAAVSTGAINEARDITVAYSSADADNTTVSAALAAKLLAATNTGTTTLGRVSATATEALGLTLTSNDVMTALTVTGVTSAADARAIFGKDIGTVTFASISDTASALAAAASVPGLLASGTEVVATTAATVAEAAKIYAANPAVFNAVYDITDTYANLMENSDAASNSVDSAAAIMLAGKVTVTDALSVAQLNQALHVQAGSDISSTPGFLETTTTAKLYEVADVYRVVDSAENVSAAMISATEAAVLFKAASVTVSNGVSLKFDHIGTPGANSLHIVGTRAEIEALPASFATANKLIEVSVADLVANSAYYSSLPANVGYRVVDTYANLSSGNTLIEQADGITVTDNITMAQAVIARDLILDAGEVSYSLADTAANLLSSASQFAGVLTASINVTATTPVTAVQAATILTAVGTSGKATYSIVDTNDSLVTTNTDVFDAAKDITVTSTANGSITAAQAEVLLAAKNTGATVIAHVSGTVAGMQGLLLDKGANDTITKVTVTGNSTPDVTVAELNTIAGLASSTVYSLKDKAANLVSAGSSVLNGATKIEANDKVTVAQLEVLDAAAPTVQNTVASISDTAENLLKASPALLAAYDSTAITVKGNISAATASQLQNFEDVNLLNINVEGATLADSSANLLLVANANVVAAATKVTVTDTMTAARADQVRTAVGTIDANNTLAYNLSDTYGNLATRAAAANGAANVTITNTIGAAQAKTADEWTGTASYSVSDTAANVANAAYQTALAKANSVSVSNAATLAQAARISEMANVATYAIKDDAANVFAALNRVNGLNAQDRETVLGASTITLDTKATVDEAVGVAGTSGNDEKLGLGTIPGLAFKVSDTAEKIAAALRDPAKASILLNAATVELSDGSAATLADLTLIADILGSAFLYDVVDATLGTSEYRITDTFSNIQLGDPTLVLDAAAVTAKGTNAADVIDMGALSRAITIDLTETVSQADVVVLNAAVGTGSDTGRVAVNGAGNDTGEDTIDDFAFGTDTIRVVASNVTSFVHGDDTGFVITAGGDDNGSFGSFVPNTGLIELNQTTNGDLDDLGDIAVMFTSPGGTADETTFEAALQYDLTGTSGADLLTGGGLADTIRGGDGNDTITGGAGADNLDGGAGDDTFVYASMGEFVASGTVLDSIIGGVGAADKIQVKAAISIVTGDSLARVGTVEQLVAESQSGTARAHSIVQGTDAKLSSIRTIDLSGDTHAGSSGEINLNGITSAITGTTLKGVANGVNTITGGAGVDNITGGSVSDVITGGAGADVINAGAGLDTVVVAAGDTVLTIGGTGNAGTIAGFDVVSNLAAGTGTVNSETLNTVGTASVVGNTASFDGNNSTLTIGSAVVASHAISNGIITFDDADTFGSALVISTAADVAAVVQYLQANDLGNAGATVAFDVGADTYVYTQGSDEGTNNTLDVLVQLVGVQATSLITTNAVDANALFIA